MPSFFQIGLSTGSLLVLAGALLLGLVPHLVHEAIRDGVKLETPSSPLYESFRNSSAKGVTVLKTFYFYHVTNPEHVVAGTERPHVELKGPYVVREIETYNESFTHWLPNATMRYKSYTVYHEQTDQSADFGENITIPRLSFFAARKLCVILDQMIGKDPLLEGIVVDFLKLNVLTALETTSPFVTKPVRELLYGYNDTLMNQLLSLQGMAPMYFALNADSTPIGYLKDDTVNEMYTGGVASATSPPAPDNAYKWMTMWHGMRELPGYWKTADANRIAGTDATGFHPFIKKGESLLVFVNSLVRKITLTYLDEVEYNGIKAYRHILDPEELLGMGKVPANGDYYMTHDGWLPSPPSMVARPVNFTKAMFLDADRSIVNVSGIPSWPRSSVDTFLDIEPLTGTLVRVHKRLQVNTEFKRTSWDTFPILKCVFSGFKNASCQPELEPWKQLEHVTETMMPVFFEDEGMELPSSITDDMKKSIFVPLLLSKVLGGLAVAIGAVLAIAAVTVRILQARRVERDYRDHAFYLIDDDEKKANTTDGSRRLTAADISTDAPRRGTSTAGLN